MRPIILIGVLALSWLPLSALAGPVNVNTADAATISAELKGIGPAVEYREKYGPFESIDDLTLVSGIGERTIEQNRADILLADPGGG